MFRCLFPALVAQLALGCSTFQTVDPSGLQRQLRSSRSPIALRTQDGSTVRLDPNTRVRFYLNEGSVSRWIRGGDLWCSALGLSFDEKKGVLQLQWNEIAGAELANLSSGKTAAAILLGPVIVVLAVLTSRSVSTGRSPESREADRAPIAQRPLRRPGPGGVHLHANVPVVARVPSEIPPEEDPSIPPEAPAVPVERPVREVRASPLFEPGTRRRFKIQLVAAAAAGTELVRFDRYSGSLYVGMRLRDAFELGGGVRHMLAPLPPSAGEELKPSIVGFGRIGAHLGFGVSKRLALATSLDAGSGHNALLQLKLNIGLRVKPTEKLSIGLFPFSPTFNSYDEDSAFRGALRWTFPTTLELAFNY